MDEGTRRPPIVSDGVGFLATYPQGVLWSTLRVAGSGTSGDIPEIDYAESLLAHNEGCLTLAVAPAEVEVEIRVAAEGPPADQTVVFTGGLSTPEGILEIGDLVGDDFVHRFRVPAGETEIVVSADVPEEAAKVQITVPAVIGELR